MKQDYLDSEEQDILDFLEKGEWQSVPNLAAQKEMFKQIAKRSSAKTKRITLRVTEQDYALAHIKAIKNEITQADQPLNEVRNHLEHNDTKHYLFQGQSYNLNQMEKDVKLLLKRIEECPPFKGFPR